MDYWPYHLIKWAAFYPPMIYIWIRDVRGWKWKAIAVVMAWFAWSVAANLTRPEHWGPATWGWSIFSISF